MLLTCLVILCIPFSVPSIYLAQRLCRKKFLNSVFNQHAAVMMIFSGKYIITLKTNSYHKIKTPLIHFSRTNSPVQYGGSNPETPYRVSS